MKNALPWALGTGPAAPRRPFFKMRAGALDEDFGASSVLGSFGSMRPQDHASLGQPNKGWSVPSYLVHPSPLVLVAKMR